MELSDADSSDSQPLVGADGHGDLTDLAAPMEPTEEFKNVASKLRLCAALADRLRLALGFGWKWITGLARLMMYSFILWPGFFLMILFYFFSNRVKRNVWYRRKARNLLDLYVPYRHWMANGKVPVVVFVTGGAWMIGYKAWGALLGRRLSQRGIMVACLDYRNFPQGQITDMVEDVGAGIGWVLGNIHRYGGDRHRVFVMGQSCGGHIAALAIIDQIQRLNSKAKERISSGGDTAAGAAASPNFGPTPEASPDRRRNGVSDELRVDLAEAGSAGVGSCSLRSPGNRSSRRFSDWDPRKLQGFIALSCPFDIAGLQDHFYKRGLNRRLLRALFHPQPQELLDPLPPDPPLSSAARRPLFFRPSAESPSHDTEPVAYTHQPPKAQSLSFLAVSPSERLTLAGSAVCQHWPPTLLLHGTHDATVPHSESLKLRDVLAGHGVDVTCKLYDGETHTSPLLEQPMSGGRDEVLEDVLEVLGRGLDGGVDGTSSRGHPVVQPWPLLPFPRLLTYLARKVCPF